MARSDSPDRAGERFAARGTRLESVGEIRRALKERRPPKLKESARTNDAIAFRPAHRPAIALLCILDDGREDGEWLRLRDDQYLIGRTEGDIRIAHDTMISGRHAQLTRRLENGRTRWYLADLASTNGTYVRIGDAIIKHNQELLIGRRRYRFEESSSALAEDATEPELEDARSRWTNGSDSTSAWIVEITANGEGQRFALKDGENWIGGNQARCNVFISDDPLVNPRHTRVYRDPKGRWHAQNRKTLNGTWLRIDSMALDTACQFQLGEQRFILKVL